MKKKLLITTDCFFPRWDGIARFLKELLPTLCKEFEVTIAAPQFEGVLPELPDIQLHRYPLMKIRFGDIYFSWVPKRAISYLVKQSDIVFNQTLGTIGMAAIKAAKKNNVPVVSYVHSIDWELSSRAIKHGKVIVELFVKNLAKRKYNQCELLITPSTEVSDVLSVTGIRTKKTIVPLGIDTNRFVPASSKDSAKSKLKIDPKETVIGFCGRIGREKDLPTLLNAFRRLQHKHNVRLLIVGSGIEEHVFKNPRITHAGTVNNVIPYLQAMDIFVLPSLTETSSLATMEAMACGVPVIATPVGSIKEYIEDGVNGFIFPRQDIDILAEKLDALVKSPEVREKVGKAGRETITQRATWEQTAQKITQILQKG